MGVILHQIDPIAIQFPQVGAFHPSIHWYGVMYLLAFGVAWWLGRSRIRAGRLPGVDAEQFGDLLFYGILGVIPVSYTHLTLPTILRV